MLRGDIYCVLTSQATPLSVGLSFLLMPLFFTGVTETSSRNNSSSSGSSVSLTLGGLIKQVQRDDQHCYAIEMLRSPKNLSYRETILVYTEVKKVKRYSQIWLHKKFRFVGFLQGSDGILCIPAK